MLMYMYSINRGFRNIIDISFSDNFSKNKQKLLISRI
ncbi:hypothetical protein SAMN05444274_10456 [Mariniphaga anaerophila]|uniref:Uncharacterized protein n=1 Tax=Mariniphaga anaerophila TaxID=1484053 RepID=A0A1M4ZT40_9BACT|nr:hypothetical protein SAMN05444274_10456 [Mariniphaga anaerophila]